MRRSALGAGIAVAAIALGCQAKPCDPVPASETAKSLGIVLDGGRLCKEEREVADIEYPEAKSGEGLATLYTTTLGKAGWTSETPAEGTLLLTRGDDTLFIVTLTRSKQSNIPSAIVRYCQDAGCREQLTALAVAMKKRSR
jgi:hypothetical protein